MYDITIYTKDYCPFCKAAKSLLDAKGIPFTNIEISHDHRLKEEMIARSNGKQTVPQIFFGEKHIGGATDLMFLEEEGLLEPLLRLSKAA